MLKIRRPLGRLIFNMGIAIPGKTVFLIETAPWNYSGPKLILTLHKLTPHKVCCGVSLYMVKRRAGHDAAYFQYPNGILFDTKEMAYFVFGD